MVSAKAIIDLSAKIAQVIKPRRIVLFGSYGYGQPTPDSDVDLLIVTSKRPRGHAQASRARGLGKGAFPLDIIVRSADDIRRRIGWNDFFLKEATEKGIVLYASDNA